MWDNCGVKLANQRDFSIISPLWCINFLCITCDFGSYSWITREIHGVFPEKIHHFDTENTCISSVILEYVSAGSRFSQKFNCYNLFLLWLLSFCDRLLSTDWVLLRPNKHLRCFMILIIIKFCVWISIRNIFKNCFTLFVVDTHVYKIFGNSDYCNFA